MTIFLYQASLEPSPTTRCGDPFLADAGKSGRRYHMPLASLPLSGHDQSSLDYCKLWAINFLTVAPVKQDGNPRNTLLIKAREHSPSDPLPPVGRSGMSHKQREISAPMKAARQELRA
ncbi:hypothetical protein [Aeromonas sp. MdU4]|uniref:hypothetical protein n=1 Tax=Aeromonas sp. MdU4 TaxID=3342819 RepID=UPI0035B8AF7C